MKCLVHGQEALGAKPQQELDLLIPAPRSSHRAESPSCDRAGDAHLLQPGEQW